MSEHKTGFGFVCLPKAGFNQGNSKKVGERNTEFAFYPPAKRDSNMAEIAIGRTKTQRHLCPLAATLANLSQGCRAGTREVDVGVREMERVLPEAGGRRKSGGIPGGDTTC